MSTRRTSRPRRHKTVMKHTMLLALLVSACDHRAPTAPTVPAPAVAPPATPTPRTFVTFRLTGFVRDDQDTPIAGARVTLVGSSPAPPVVTDATGFYETSASIDTLFVVPTANLTIRKDGYEDVDNAAIFRNRQDATADYRMFRKTMVPAGTNARFSIAFNGPLCGLELEYPCRHIVVMAPTRGTLVIETVSDMPSQRFPFGPVPPVSYGFQGVTRLSKPVRAGEAVPVEILWVWSGTGWTSSGSESFTLKTSLEP